MVLNRYCVKGLKSLLGEGKLLLTCISMLKVIQKCVEGKKLEKIQQEQLFRKNWYLTGVKINLSLAHKTRFWYL